jgi:bacterioferritin-associated ferredoxin
MSGLRESLGCTGQCGKCGKHVKQIRDEVLQGPGASSGGSAFTASSAG